MGEQDICKTSSASESELAWAAAPHLRYDAASSWLCDAERRTPSSTLALMQLLRKREDGVARWCWGTRKLPRGFVLLDEQLGFLQDDLLECPHGRAWRCPPELARSSDVERVWITRLDTWGALGRVVWQVHSHEPLVRWSFGEVARLVDAWSVRERVLLDLLAWRAEHLTVSPPHRDAWRQRVERVAPVFLEAWELERSLWDLVGAFERAGTVERAELLWDIRRAQLYRAALALCADDPYTMAWTISQVSAFGHMACMAAETGARAADLLEGGEREHRRLMRELERALMPSSPHTLTAPTPLRHLSI